MDILICISHLSSRIYISPSLLVGPYLLFFGVNFFSFQIALSCAQAILENFELLILACDEMVDDGIILEISAQAVFNQVAPHASTGGESPLSALHSMAKVVKQNL